MKQQEGDHVCRVNVNLHSFTDSSELMAAGSDRGKNTTTATAIEAVYEDLVRG